MKCSSLVISIAFLVLLAAGCGGSSEAVMLESPTLIYDLSAPDYFVSLEDMSQAAGLVAVGEFGGFEDEDSGGFRFRTFSFAAHEILACKTGDEGLKSLSVRTRCAMLLEDSVREDGAKVSLAFAAPTPWHIEPEEGGTYIVFLKYDSVRELWQPVGCPWMIKLGWFSAKLCVSPTNGEADFTVTATAETESGLYQKQVVYKHGAEGMPSDFLEGMGRREALKALGQ